MQVLGIDPNKDFIAWALIQVKNDRESIIEYGQIDDDKYYYNNLLQLIKKHDVISIEDFQYYHTIPISDSSIRAIKRIGHVQLICTMLYKVLWEFKRPDILLRLFGSRSVSKPKSKKLFKVRLGADLKRIPQHNLDAAMVGVHAYYHIMYENRLKNEV